MEEHDISSPVVTLDDLLRCQSLVVDKHLFTQKGASTAASRARSLLIAGVDQVTQWIDDIQQGRFNQPQATIVLQRSAMDDGTSFTKEQVNHAFGALKAMHADLLDMRNGDSDSISDRHQGHGRKKPVTAQKTRQRTPDASDDEPNMVPPSYVQTGHVPAQRSRNESMASLEQMSMVLDEERKSYASTLWLILTVMNGDQRMKPERKAEIQFDLQHLSESPENLHTWAKIRPR